MYLHLYFTNFRDTMGDAENDGEADIECWPAARRKEELKRCGLSTGGTKNSQICRLRKELERKRAELNFSTNFMSEIGRAHV
jgi:hypothetical protein